MLQYLPLDIKILKTKLRIREWVHKFGEDGVYISFSGGKDSTVLLDIIREDYPNIVAVFIDTGLEYPEIREFVNTFDNVKTIRPEMPFNKVIDQYGYPLVSKEIAKNIYYGRAALKRNDIKMVNTYINGYRYNKKTGKDYIFMPLAQKWIPLFESDIPVSNKCCQIMKKDPAKKYGKETGRYPFIGEMAEDSKEREMHYLKSSCNAFNGKSPKSKPMGFWREQDVLQYLKDKGLQICSVYGDIIETENGKLKTTGVNRTGCVFCGFGVHLQEQPNKFQKMKATHPKLWDYCIRPVEENGLGMGTIFDFINVKYQ